MTGLRQVYAEYQQYDALLESREDALIHQGLAEAYLGLGELDAAEEAVRH